MVAVGRASQKRIVPKRGLSDPGAAGAATKQTAERRRVQDAAKAAAGTTNAEQTNNAIAEALRKQLGDSYKTGGAKPADWQRNVSEASQRQPVQAPAEAQQTKALANTSNPGLPPTPSADYSAVPRHTTTESNKVASRVRPPGLDDVAAQREIDDPPGRAERAARSKNPELRPTPGAKSDLAKRTDGWLPQLAADRAGGEPHAIPYGDAEKMADLKSAGYQLGANVPPASKSVTGRSRMLARRNHADQQKPVERLLHAHGTPAFEQRLAQLAPDKAGREYIRGAKNPDEMRARATEVHGAHRTLDKLGKLQRKVTDTGKPAGESAIPWTDSAVKRTVAFGEKNGAVNDAIKKDSYAAADGLLGVDADSDLGGPPVKMDGQAFGKALVDRLPRERLNEASAVGAIHYINNASTLGEQRERAAGALQTFQTLDKAGRPPLTAFDKSKDYQDVSPQLASELKGKNIHRAYDKVAPYVGVPGKHKVPLDSKGKRSVKLVNDDSGKTVKADYKKKKSSFLKKALGAVLTVASVIPSPIQPFAAAASGVMGAVNGFKNGDILGGLAGAATAVTGFAGGVAKMVGGTALNATARTLGGASKVLGGVANTARAIRDGDALGVLSGAAGVVGDLAGGASQKLAAGARNVQRASDALVGVRDKDLGRVLTAGAGLVEAQGNTGLARRLEDAGTAAGAVQAAQAGDINRLAYLAGDAYNRSQVRAQQDRALKAAPPEAAPTAAERAAPGAVDPAAPGATPAPDQAAAGAPSPAAGDAATSAYTVQPGDTLSEIAAKTGQSVDELLQANPQLSDPNRIRAGEAVNVPGGADALAALDAYVDQGSDAAKALDKADSFLRDTGFAPDDKRIAKTLSAAHHERANLDADIGRLEALDERTPAQQASLDNAKRQRNSVNRNIGRTLRDVSQSGRLDQVMRAAQVYDSFTKESQVSNAGKATNLVAQDLAGAALVRANPVVGIADAGVQGLDAALSFFGVPPELQPGSYVSPGKLISGAVDNITGLGDAALHRDTAATQSLHEANLSGRNGKAFQLAARAGEYWNQHGVAGGLKLFWNTVRGN